MADELARVDALIDDLLAAHDPTATDIATFRGAQYDRGLAWVHFPEGFGGLDLAPRVATAHRATPARRRCEVAAGRDLLQPVPRRTDDGHARQLTSCASARCARCSPAKTSGASCSRSPAPAPTSPASRRVASATARSGSRTARKSGTRSRTSRTRECSSRGPTPSCRSTRASRTSWSTCTQPGVEVRPLRQITGEAEFNEVYLTDARIPDADRIGDVGDGWRVSMTTLMNERTTIGAGTGGPKRGGGSIAEAIYTWNHTTDHSPARRDQLMKLWCDAGGAAPHQHARRAAKRAPATPVPKDRSPSSRSRPSTSRSTSGASTRSARRASSTTTTRSVARARRCSTARPGSARKLFLRSRGELDRGRHVGDHAQHPRRAHPRSAGRTARRPRPAVVAGAEKLTTKGRDHEHTRSRRPAGRT